MVNSTAFSKRNISIIFTIGAVFMTALSARLLLDVASLSFSIHRLVGFSGILLANSLVLTYVSSKMIVIEEHAPTKGEKIVLLLLSLFTGVSLLLTYLDH